MRSNDRFTDSFIAPGDRSHIPDEARPIYEILNADMQRVKAKAPSNYKTHVVDTEKRLNILFDHLNNEDLLKPDTIQDMNALAQHIQAREYDQAIAIFSDLMKNKNDEGSNWMVSFFIHSLLLWIKANKYNRLVSRG